MQQNHVTAIIPDLREILIRRALVLTVRRSKGTLFADPTNNDCSATEQGDAMKDRLGSVQACTRAHHLVLTAAVLIPAALLSCKVHAGGFDARYVAYQGDLNGDGRTDLYVKWTPQIVTMKWFRAVAADKGLTIDEQQLGLDIMHAHVMATDTDAFGIIHLLSKRQITDYHVRVFKSYGLPDYTFGGAPLGGKTGGGALEWFLGEWLWCPDCDRVP